MSQQNEAQNLENPQIKQDKSCQHCINHPEPVSDDKAQINFASILEHAEWFKYFDENFLPIEVQRTKENYEFALKKFKSKCLSAFKYYRQCEKYEHQLKHEQEEITRLEHEVKDLEFMYKNHMEIGLKAADFVENFNLENLNDLLSQAEEPKHEIIAFQAFLQLGPEGTQGGSDISWNYIKKLIQNKKGLAGMMRDMFKGRIKDISRAEVENAQHTIKHFINEFAGKDDDNVKAFVRAMGFYVHCCIGCWDLNEGIQARKELISTKSAKLDHVRNEFEICKDIVKVLDTEVAKEFEIYMRVRDEYAFMEREREEADDAFKTFAEHCMQIDFESSKHVKDSEKIEALLKDLEKDCEAFNILQMKCNYPVIEDVKNS